MDTPETNGQSTMPTAASSSLTRPLSAYSRSEAVLSPQACATCQGAADLNPDGQDTAPSYIYALGHVEARFPRVSVEKEFAQVAGRAADSNGKTDREMFQSVLSQRENRYLARQLCWVMTIQGLDTYLLQPRDPADFDLLLGALRPASNPLEIDVVIGLRGPIAAPEVCNGLMIPIVVFDQIYSFGRDALISAIPRPEKMAAKGFEATAQEVFERVMQLTDNAGATDEHRALNYLVMRYPAIYATVADAHGRNASLTGVDVRPSRLSGTRKIVDVILSFTNRNNDFTEKFFTRVDVTEEFPFLVTRMSPYYDR
jgi:PatG C-terminal